MTVWVESNAYFDGVVNLSLAITPIVPSGLEVSMLDPAVGLIPSVTRGAGVDGWANITTALGNYTVTVTGTSGNLTRVTSFTLTVAPAIPPEDFTITLAPTPDHFLPGGHSDVSIAVSRAVPTVVDDLWIHLTLTISPVNLNETGFPGLVFLPAGQEGLIYTFTVHSNASTTPGVYTLNATGTNYSRQQSLSHSKTAAMTVDGSSQLPPGNQPNNPSSSSWSSWGPALVAIVKTSEFWIVMVAVGGVVIALVALLVMRRARGSKKADPAQMANWKPLQIG